MDLFMDFLSYSIGLYIFFFIYDHAILVTINL